MFPIKSFHFSIFHKCSHISKTKGATDKRHTFLESASLSASICVVIKSSRDCHTEINQRLRTIFDFFKIRLLSFCTAELKSEDIFVFRRVRAFSGYSFCWLNPQTTCLFTLVYCTVKTFQPPSSLHRDCFFFFFFLLLQ